eukprot:CAMPEP_0168374400 /NCGR_PEP_ID=MMETSP0228-20121227/9281_1 /TAXON_ID=133427 /ORGANISM="Protoceratium reticulatum, Strain CCCM 535 (=CCMP 1889)" /LENGTH=85 /DNA_ID=CAMNT_0008387345 /DNA_START=474 /DNA_END=731 /DNA_ORIENTATION=+
MLKIHSPGVNGIVKHLVWVDQGRANPFLSVPWIRMPMERMLPSKHRRHHTSSMRGSSEGRRSQLQQHRKPVAAAAVQHPKSVARY